MVSLRTTARAVGTLVSLGLIAISCGLEQSHGYVQSADGSLSFRHPPHWEEVEVERVGIEWAAGLDGAESPSSDHGGDDVQEAPFLVAQVLPLTGEHQDRISLARLRQMAMVDGRDPTADAADIRLVFHDQIVDEHGFEGHHLRFEIESENGTATAEHLAVLDPARNRVERVRVACSSVCFEANLSAIEDVFASVRFRK